MNVDVDIIASEMSWLADKGHAATLSPVIAPFYAGSKALLQIGKAQLTSHMKKKCTMQGKLALSVPTVNIRVGQ